MKVQLRKEALARRNGLDPESRIEMILQAGEYAYEAISIEPGCIVSGFWPIRSEIDPRPLMASLQNSGARLCLPVVVDKTTIIFRELLQNSTLIETGFGTIGPGPDAEVLDPQILLVPLSAFDDRGGRMGYGAGFYDRAVKKLQKKGGQPRLIGVAFANQQVDKVPMEPHDQRLDMVITELGVTPDNRPTIRIGKNEI